MVRLKIRYAKLGKVRQMYWSAINRNLECVDPFATLQGIENHLENLSSLLLSNPPLTATRPGYQFSNSQTPTPLDWLAKGGSRGIKVGMVMTIANCPVVKTA